MHLPYSRHLINTVLVYMEFVYSRLKVSTTRPPSTYIFPRRVISDHFWTMLLPNLEYYSTTVTRTPPTLDHKPSIRNPVLFHIMSGSRTTEPLRRVVRVHCWRRPDFQTTQSWGEFVKIATTELWRSSGGLPTPITSAAIHKISARSGEIMRRRLLSTIIMLKHRNPPGLDHDAFVQNLWHLLWSWDKYQETHLCGECKRQLALVLVLIQWMQFTN